MSSSRIAIGLRGIVRSPGFVAVLSFVVPGLGQAVLGHYRRAVAFAIPAVVLAAVALQVGTHGFVSGALSPAFLTGILAVDILTLVYHIWAVVDAYLLAARMGRTAGGASGAMRSPDRMPVRRVETRPLGTRPAGRRMAAWSTPVLAITLIATLGVHLLVAQVAAKDLTLLNGIFAPQAGFLRTEDPSVAPPVIIETPTPSPSSTGFMPPPVITPSPTVEPTPPPTAWANDGRLNLLVIGTDAGQGRVSLRPDTMILVTIDLKTHRSAMIGVPRNMWNVPLPNPSARLFSCRCFPGMLNALYQEAMAYPQYFPGGDQRGFKAMEGAIGELTGLKVDGTVLVNLMGFVNLIDALGGLDINVPAKVVDKPGLYPGYEGYVPPEGVGHVSFVIEPGPQHMDGHRALEYARSRAQDWDYARMQRQQIVLLAIRKQIAHPCSLAPKVLDILDAISKNGGSFWTDMPIESAPQLLSVAERVGAGNAASITLDPATTGAGCTADGSKCDYLTAASVAKIRSIAAHALDKVPSSDAGGGSDGGGFGC